MARGAEGALEKRSSDDEGNHDQDKADQRQQEKNPVGAMLAAVRIRA